MKTLTINLPDTLDPAVVRWELARSLYDKKEITLEEAAKMVDLAPTYFKMRLAGMLTGLNLTVSNVPDHPFDPERIRQLADEMDIQESWEDLVAMIGK